MDKNDYGYLGTTLEEIQFNKNVLKKEFELRLNIIQKNGTKNKMCIVGEMDILINNITIGSIKMQSVFEEKNKNKLNKIELSSLESTEQTYFVKPVLSELSLLMSILSQKAVRLPLILPIDNFNIISIDNDVHDLNSLIKKGY